MPTERISLPQIAASDSNSIGSQILDKFQVLCESGVNQVRNLQSVLGQQEDNIGSLRLHIAEDDMVMGHQPQASILRRPNESKTFTVFDQGQSFFRNFRQPTQKRDTYFPYSSEAGSPATESVMNSCRVDNTRSRTHDVFNEIRQNRTTEVFICTVTIGTRFGRPSDKKSVGRSR